MFKTNGDCSRKSTPEYSTSTQRTVPAHLSTHISDELKNLTSELKTVGKKMTISARPSYSQVEDASELQPNNSPVPAAGA